MAYNKTNWENSPSTNTPINANNLNKIEEGIYQNSLKADQVGDLTTLATNEKSNLVGAINEVNGKLSKIESIYSGSIYSGTDTLSKSIENYDFLLVVIRGATYTRGTTLIPVSLVNYGSGDTTPWSIVVYQTNSVYGAIKLNFTDATTISVERYNAGWGNTYLENIIGIKL
jgi:hypothetical protein